MILITFIVFCFRVATIRHAIQKLKEGGKNAHGGACECCMDVQQGEKDYNSYVLETSRNDQSQKTKDKDSSKKFQDPKDKIIEEYK